MPQPNTSDVVNFNYLEAFSRQLGLLTPDELARVRRARIGIGGLGGCGSNHLLALTRMGFERFAIADPDAFDLSNFNRQAGARLSSVGRRKVDVMRDMVLEINPEADLLVYGDGLSNANFDEFIDKTDIGINAIDFFRVDLYPNFHDAYRARGKYSVVGASPFAFGASLTVIGPDTPSFKEFFSFSQADRREEALKKFWARMTPSRFAGSYLPPGVFEVRSPLADTQIVSTAAAVYLCSALTAAEVLFIVTGKRPPTRAPEILEFDMLLRSFSRTSAGMP